MINPNTPFLTPDGRVAREWLTFFYAIANAVGGVNDQPDLTSLLSTMDENFSATIEIEKNLDALRNALALDDSLRARMAELENSLNALANGQIDGQVALIAEALAVLRELQVQSTVQDGTFARLAEIEKQLDDIQVSLLFSVVPPTPLFTAQGNFTPTLVGATTPGNNTYSVQRGYYSVIGNIVAFSIYLSLSAKDAAMAGSVSIAGLPYASNSPSGQFHACSIGDIENISLASGRTSLQAYIASNAAAITLMQFGSGQAYAALDSSNITSSSTLILTGTYFR